MVKEEALKFFDRVKGKKIRWSGWEKNQYFIPEFIIGNIDLQYEVLISGIKFEYNGSLNFKTDYYIVNGFKPNLDGEFWELVVDLEEELGKL